MITNLMLNPPPPPPPAGKNRVKTYICFTHIYKKKPIGFFEFKSVTLLISTVTFNIVPVKISVSFFPTHTHCVVTNTT